MPKTEYKVNDSVIYPHHGAAVIKKIYEKDTRVFVEGTGGEESKLITQKKKFIKMEIINTNLEIDIPESNFASIGIRNIVNENGVKEILNILSSNYEDNQETWARRFKASIAKMSTARVEKIAEIVRDLHHRSRIAVLSSEEKRMLAKARKILVSELVLARNINIEEGHELVNDALGFTPNDLEKENPIYGASSHNLTSIDTAGGIGIHRIKNVKSAPKIQMLTGDEKDASSFEELVRQDESKVKLLDLDDDNLIAPNKPTLDPDDVMDDNDRFVEEDISDIVDDDESDLAGNTDDGDDDFSSGTNGTLSVDDLDVNEPN